MTVKQVLSELIAEGISDLKIQTMTGLSAQRITDLKAEEGFSALVEEAKALPHETVMDDGYELLEKRTLRSLQESIVYAEDPVKLKTLEMIHKRHIGLKPVQQPTQTHEHIVRLVLPQHAVPTDPAKVLYNNNNEIIAVGERNFAALPSASVRALFAGIEKDRSAPLKDQTITDIE